VVGPFLGPCVAVPWAPGTCTTKTKTTRRLSQPVLLCTSSKTPPPREVGSYAAMSLCLPERWAPVLPRGSTHVSTPLAPPPREAGSHATTWPHARGRSLGSASLIGGLLCCHVAPRLRRLPLLHLPKRRAPVLPRGSTPVAAPLASPPQKASSHAATWLRTCDDSLASTSPRGGLSCCCVAPCLWLHPASTSSRGGLRCYHMALEPPARCLQARHLMLPMLNVQVYAVYLS
jgi:hypothetical protein